MKLTFCLIGFCFILFACSEENITSPESKTIVEIKEDTSIIVLIENTPYSYFDFRDKISGFEYEILNTFSKKENIYLNYQVYNSDREKDSILKLNKVDIISSNLPINLTSEDLIFSDYFQKAKVVLARLKSRTSFTLDSLENKEIIVPKNSYFSNFLFAFRNRTGINFHIIEKDSVNTYNLLEDVQNGKINYTICQNNFVHMREPNYQKLDVSFSLSLEQRIAFGLQKKQRKLKNQLNSFLKSFMLSSEFEELKRKYFDITFLKSPVKFISKESNISPFDQIFIEVTDGTVWDWRLIAALVQKESNFNTQAIGRGGSFGVMQLMPFIGEKYGVDINSPIQKQIEAGVKILSGLIESWKNIPDLTQRTKFALASYNAGIGHIIDARNLAIELGFNPLKWDDNVEMALMKLHNSEYYKNPLVKCGAYYGHADYYVRRIFEIYIEYLELSKIEE